MSTIDKISTLLDEQNKTQKELTDTLGIDKTTFTQWKNGKSKSYRKYIKKIADFFNVPVNVFFDEESNEKQTQLYLDDETRAAVDMLRKRPEMRILFKASENATKEDILMTASILEKFKKGE